jgi:tetratricopeptide (TPR) repeat protein
MWTLLIGLARAAPFAFTTSAGATVEVLPPVEDGRTEIVIRDNRENIRQQLGFDARAGLRAWTATDVGTSWVLNVWTLDPATRLELRREGDRWTGYVRPSPRRSTEAPAGPERPLVEVLTRPPGEDECGANTALPIVPLRGRDMLHAFRPTDFAPEIPRWTEAEPVAGAGWGAVNALQREVAGVRDAQELRRVLYTLGALHRNLGHAREAAYYFGRADEAGVPDGIARIQRAGAHLAARQWQQAREQAVRASEAGVSDVAVLEVAGVAALMAQDVAAAPIGRAITRRSARPEASLVAGTLLLRANCAGEAIRPLQRARLLTGERDAMGRMLLADALLLAGQRREAAVTLARVALEDTPKRWQGMLSARSRLSAMVAVTPDQWPSFVPSLEMDADRGGDEALESLFLLGQVGEALGDARLAHDSYMRVLNASRHFAEGEVGRRMVTIWGRRLGELLGSGRAMDAVAFHAGTWRSSLLPLVREPSLLRNVAETAAGLGLYEPALVTLRDVATLEGRLGSDDRQTILALADAYRASGRLEAAIETLDFLKTRPRDPMMDARAALQRTRTLEAMGDGKAARAGYQALLAAGKAVPLSVADEARLRLALLQVEDGTCREALPALADVAYFPPDLSPGIVGIARSRCLFTLGDAVGARAAASAAVAWLAAPEVALWADYLSRIGADTRGAGSKLPSGAAVVAAPDPTAPPSEGAAAVAPAPRSDIWARLLREEEEAAALRARIPLTVSRK